MISEAQIAFILMILISEVRDFTILNRVLTDLTAPLEAQGAVILKKLRFSLVLIWCVVATLILTLVCVVCIRDLERN